MTNGERQTDCKKPAFPVQDIDRMAIALLEAPDVAGLT